uniref:DNA-directed RNA polymerase subunit n=1 Tax=Equus asinus TaxID=9793 RepID=A0A9L0JA64_EQUAS
MFVLVEMVDTVRIPPWQFERKLNDSIAEELNKKLANKVVYNVGLCICLFDITKLEDAYVFPGDGASHTKESPEKQAVCTDGEQFHEQKPKTRMWKPAHEGLCLQSRTPSVDLSLVSAFGQGLGCPGDKW